MGICLAIINFYLLFKIACFSPFKIDNDFITLHFNLYYNIIK